MGRAAPHQRGSRASHARQQNKCACRRSARPSIGVDANENDNPGATNAPRERRTLRCLTLLVEASQRLTCEPRCRARRVNRAPHSRVPAERASASEEPGPRGCTAKSMDLKRPVVLPLGPGSRFARPGHESAAVPLSVMSPTAPPAPETPPDALNVLDEACVAAARARRHHRIVFFLLFTTRLAGLHPSRAPPAQLYTRGRRTACRLRARVGVGACGHRSLRSPGTRERG